LQPVKLIYIPFWLVKKKKTLRMEWHVTEVRASEKHYS